MNLTFDSLDELKDFLAFAGYAKKTTSEITVDLRVSDKQLASIVTLAAEQIEGDEPAGVPRMSEASPFTTGQTGGEATDATHADAKRKRRTKAEIAADEAAKLNGVSAVTGEPITVDKPETTTTTLAEGTAPPSDIEHLRLCREFISTQGMTKYEQSFAMAGIEGKNIMAFTDADRAKHVEALNKLAS